MLASVYAYEYVVKIYMPVLCFLTRSNYIFFIITNTFSPTKPNVWTLFPDGWKLLSPRLLQPVYSAEVWLHVEYFFLFFVKTIYYLNIMDILVSMYRFIFSESYRSIFYFLFLFVLLWVNLSFLLYRTFLLYLSRYVNVLISVKRDMYVFIFIHKRTLV